MYLKITKPRRFTVFWCNFLEVLEGKVGLVLGPWNFLGVFYRPFVKYLGLETLTFPIGGSLKTWLPYTVFPVPYIQNTVHTVHKNSNTVHTVHNKTIPYLLHLEPMKKYFWAFTLCLIGRNDSKMILTKEIPCFTWKKAHIIMEYRAFWYFTLHLMSNEG